MNDPLNLDSEALGKGQREALRRFAVSGFGIVYADETCPPESATALALLDHYDRTEPEIRRLREIEQRSRALCAAVDNARHIIAGDYPDLIDSSDWRDIDDARNAIAGAKITRPST